MNNRKILLTLAGAAVLAAGFGCAPSPSTEDGAASKPKDETIVATNATPPEVKIEGGVKDETPATGEEKPAAEMTGETEATKAPEGVAPGSPPANPGGRVGGAPGGPPGAPPGPPGGGGNRGGGGFGRGGGMAFMIGNDQIKKELGITADQAKKIEALMPQRGGGGGNGDGGGDVSREDRQKQFEELQGKIEAVLTPAQKARIQEIQYQTMGSRAFTNPDVVKALGITGDQTKKLEELQPQRGGPGGGPGGGAPGGGAARPQTGPGGDAPRGGGGPGGGGGQRMSPEERQKQREERMAKALAILTPAQKAKWQKMIGKPFEMQFQPPGGGGGGRGPGGGGGGRGA